MDVKVYLSKEMLRSDGESGQKYEVTVYPIPEDHTKIADLIKSALNKISYGCIGAGSQSRAPSC